MIKADFYICPECGAEVRVGSKGCLRCASDRATKHWEQDEIHDGLDLPDEEFDYDEFLDSEFHDREKKTSKQRFWWVVAVVLLVAWLALVFGLRAWPEWIW